MKTISMLCGLFIIWNARAFPGGTYTINSGAVASASNYVSFTAFANDLKNITRGDGGAANYALGGAGVQGPVVVNVTAATYTSQLKLTQILGVTATNTVTINGNGAILQYTAVSTTDAATIDLDGTDFFRIRGLEVRSNGTYGYCIWMHNAADNNIIRKNNLKCPNFTTTTQTGYIWLTNGNTSPTVSYGNCGNFNLIDSNDMRSGAANGPYYAVVVVGPTAYGATNACNNNTISNNNIQDFYIYGIYAYYTSGTTIKGNTVHNTGVTRYTTKYGLYLYYTSTIIDGNKIYNLNGSTPQAGTMYPIYWYNYDNGTTFSAQKFRNNIIHVFGTGAIYSYMYFYASILAGATLDIENNTFAYAYNSAVANTSTIYELYGSYWRNVENNIIYNNHQGTGTKYLHYDNGGCVTYGNWRNNNFSFASTATGTLNFGYGGSPCVTTSSMAGMYAAGMPASNISVDPDFIDLSSISDLTPTAAGMANKGKVITGLTTDFKGATRSATTPDIGALEYTVDIAVTAFPFTFPSPACAGYTSQIGGTIQNNSAFTLKNPTMAYRVNNNAKVTYAVPATIAPGASFAFNFPGTYKFSVSGPVKVSIFVSSPDDVPANDSMSVSSSILVPPGGSILTQNTSLSSTFAKFDITGKPDITFESEKMVYDFTAPSRVGFTNADYASKWIATVSAKTINGFIANSTVSTNSAAPLTATVNATKFWEDSTIVLSMKFIDMTTGCDTIYTRRILIAPKSVPGVKLPSVLCEKTEIYFENTTTVSSGSVDYIWDFGDGTPVSTETNPIHTYTSSGTYVVNLKATTTPYGFVSTKQVTVNITPVPEAKIININACEGTAVTLGNGTIYGGTGTTSYAWNYGDGSPVYNTTSAAKIFKSYAIPGGYAVVLTATANGCANVVTKNVYQFAKPVANFSKLTGVCLNSDFVFDNTSTISIGHFGNTWDFNDAGNKSSESDPVYMFQSAGVKNIKLKVVSEFACSDSITKQVTVSEIPTTDFTYPFACSRTATPFNNTTNLNGQILNDYLWNFGDGSTSSATNPSKNWTSVGPKTVTLTTNLSNGCSSTQSKILNVGVQPNVNFDAEGRCAGTDIPFTNYTTYVNGTILYEWTFGDGITSTLPAPVHNYGPGVTQTYIVQLKASIVGGCNDSISKAITVQPLPTTCDFDVVRNSTVSLTNYTYTPKGGSLNGIAYKWLTGDGTKLSSNGAGTNYSYVSSNKYCVTMIAKNQADCECTRTKCIELNTDINSAESMNNAVSVYPNPNNGIFTVALDGVIKKDMTVMVYNTLGSLIKTVVTGENNISIDLTGMATGVYIVKVIADNQIATKKINVTK